jgi:hypothetical protein
MRDFRVKWGEPVVVKKPKGVSSDLGVTGQWAVVVRRIMNGTGVLKVYLVQTKRYAYRLHFTRAAAPEWVLETLKDLRADMNIRFKEESQEYQKKLDDITNDKVNQEIPEGDEDIEDEVQIIGGDDRETVVLQSINSVEDAWDEGYIKTEPHETKATSEELELQMQHETQGHYVTRSGCVSRPPDRLIESAYAVIQETYVQNFREIDGSSAQDTIECV